MADPELDAPLLLNRYQPKELLARGGSASVFRARDLQLGRDVAVKVFLAGSESDLEQARDELRMLAQLAHHGIVAVLDAGIDESSADDPRPFLVMELLRGSTVRALIADGPLPIEITGGIAYEVAEALDYIHRQGVIHRDVSPSNIMLIDYGTPDSRPRARLTDFGIAVPAGWMPSTAGVTVGTAAYLSPEQALGERLTTASDIYSLGIVLLECFTAQHAFPGDAVTSVQARTTSEVEIPKSVPRAWRAVIAPMVRREPAERPTAAEVREQVRQVLRTRSGR